MQVHEFAKHVTKGGRLLPAKQARWCVRVLGAVPLEEMGSMKLLRSGWLLLLLLVAMSAAAEEKRPNMVFMLMDDVSQLKKPYL